MDRRRLDGDAQPEPEVSQALSEPAVEIFTRGGFDAVADLHPVTE